MNDRQLGRRGALSGAVATAVVGGAAAAPGTVAARLAGRAPKARAGEGPADACHSPFRAAFLAWLDGAAERFALPVAVDTTASPTHTKLHVQGVHPAIWISLGCEGGIDVGADWDGMNWDLLASMDVFAEPAPGGGWQNAVFLPEFRISHPTREAAWRSDGFEMLLDWVNDELAPATHLALCGSEGHYTWAWLLRDGARVQTGQPLPVKHPPAHLLPVHTADAAARVQLVGQMRSNDQNGRKTVAIGSVVQRGSHVFVYDERGRQLAMLQAGSGPNDRLQGYTGATVSVRRGAHVVTYDGRGRQLSTTPAH